MSSFIYGRRLLFTFVILTHLITVNGCSLKVAHREIVQPDEYQTLNRKAPFLKAHMHNGDLLVLEDWNIDESTGSVIGQGVHYDAGRRIIARGPATVPVDSVAIFESNVMQTSPTVAGLTVLSVLSAALTIVCIANPKSCFGSCPTFYAQSADGNVLQAEGFSWSIAPVLEDTDVDALYRLDTSGGRLEVVMTNEALETHVVRHVDLHLVPRPSSGRVFQGSEGRFWLAGEPVAPAKASGPEGDCRELVRDFDGQERFSLADSVDLAAREILELEFDSPADGRLGLVVTSRQSLLTTFLLYQGLAYLGNQAAPALAKATQVLAGTGEGRTIGTLLGKIEVQLQDAEGRWQTAGAVGETGPLATNVHFVRLPEFERKDGEPLRVRLDMTSGHWRLDQVGLVEVTGEASALRRSPEQVLKAGVIDPASLAMLTDPRQTVVTFPGDRYTLVYDLPVIDGEYEVFLESRGYYLEWMREEWLAEENPLQAAMMFLSPSVALRQLAPAFKELEPDMEAQFWESRYAQ